MSSKLINVFHQCGHNDVWNRDLYDENIGEGLIFSPKMSNSHKIDTFPEKMKQNSFFDPQFYSPHSNEKKFSKFDFFPNVIANGFETIDYEALAYKSAEKCVSFQIQQNYKFLIIPTIVYENTPRSYLERLKLLFIDPFIYEIKKQSVKQQILLSIVVKDTDLMEQDYIDELLNLITSYQEVTGVYLIPSNKSSSKRWKEMDFMLGIMKFIDVLKQNELYVHLAYSDVEGLVVSLAGIDSVSIGSYENVRRFNLNNFNEKDESKFFNQPKRRIYSTELLQWIDYEYISVLKTDYKDFAYLFENNQYIDFSVKDEIDWNLKNPVLYKHYLTSLYNQYKSLAPSYSERKLQLLEKLQISRSYNNDIIESGILFDNNSNGDHIERWITVINMFDKYKRGV